MDLGGARRLRMEILFDLLPLATHFICVELYCIACLWSIVSHGFVIWTWIWFVICDELCWLVILLWFMFILWLIEVVLMLSSSYHTYILYVVLPRFPLVGETPSKFSNFIYMCSWYSFKFISTYQAGVLSIYRTLVNLFISYSKIFKKN